MLAIGDFCHGFFEDWKRGGYYRRGVGEKGSANVCKRKLLCVARED